MLLRGREDVLLNNQGFIGCFVSFIFCPELIDYGLEALILYVPYRAEGSHLDDPFVFFLNTEDVSDIFKKCFLVSTRNGDWAGQNVIEYILFWTTLYINIPHI